MPFRVTESGNAESLKERITTANQRVALYRERLASNKRINRPSDDPGGAAAVLNLRTTQGAIDRFRRAAAEAQSTLLVADGTLESYTLSLDRARNLIIAGAGDTQTVEIIAREPADRAGTRSTVYQLRGIGARIGDTLAVVGADERAEALVLRCRWDTQVLVTPAGAQEMHDSGPTRFGVA